MKTNPAYAHLAYRRSIITSVIEHMRSNYLALADDNPPQTLFCDGVFQEDATVPPEEIVSVIEELEQESEALRLQLNKFEFIEKKNPTLLGKKRSNERRKQSK